MAKGDHVRKQKERARARKEILAEYAQEGVIFKKVKHDAWGYGTYVISEIEKPHGYIMYKPKREGIVKKIGRMVLQRTIGDKPTYECPALLMTRLWFSEGVRGGEIEIIKEAEDGT